MDVLDLVALIVVPGGTIFVMLNGLKGAITRIDKKTDKLIENDALQNTDIALVQQQTDGLETRVEKLETHT